MSLEPCRGGARVLLGDTLSVLIVFLRLRVRVMFEPGKLSASVGFG